MSPDAWHAQQEVLRLKEENRALRNTAMKATAARADSDAAPGRVHQLVRRL